jgi:cytosine/adenosine deaminase-related metal-dependent hydrolase
MKTLLIKNALRVARMDDSRSEIAGGDILVEGNAIRRVGKGLRARADRVVDASACVAFPGFVNTHHHLYQTLTRNLKAVQDAKLFDWLLYLYEVWRRLTPEGVFASAQVGLGELLLTGCTTSSDHFYLFPGGRSAGLIDREIEAARELGIRFHACRGSMSRGKSKGGLPPDDVVQTEDEILRDCERLVGKFHDPSPLAMTRVALAPCSPFSVTTELLKLSAEAARKWGVRLHTHLAETFDEEAYCLEMHKMRPLAYMESVGWLEGGISWFAHCVHMDAAESKLLGRTGTGVAHCPTSNMRLGSGIAPLRTFLDDGVPVGLGVDGSASNDSSDMLSEVRQAMLAARVRGGASSLSAREALWAATRGGARVLGRDDIGEISPGKAADIALFDLSGLDFAGSLSDPVAAAVFCGASHRARLVVVDGRVVVEDGRLALIDEEALARKANALAKRMSEEAS